MKEWFIRTESEYADVMDRIDKIFDAEPGTPEGDELKVLVDLAEKWEEEHE